MYSDIGISDIIITINKKKYFLRNGNFVSKKESTGMTRDGFPLGTGLFVEGSTAVFKDQILGKYVGEIILRKLYDRKKTRRTSGYAVAIPGGCVRKLNIIYH